ncbi:hypothetical protein JD844_006234 [Phrynosoma platyrhinos]|uniref:Uncharacterized protein n=1 Tax=Phrynosoma platyrhinos TaxID=52577 RepID=A0ABQ7T1G4_PHRPL|nr:hypothetical protein JD844_006234 [Phrynosoma platyrhinos]
MPLVLSNLTLISTPVEHAPVSTSCAPSAMPPASSNQPATAAHSAVHQMSLPSAMATSAVHDSISSTCQSFNRHSSTSITYQSKKRTFFVITNANLHS